ncbi:MAG: phosphoadenylyl-sulfate reductase [Dehalococcoidia bacterium]
MTQTKTYTPEELANLSLGFEGQAPEAVMRWAAGEFFPDLVLACSFGGPSGMVLVDIMAKIEPQVEIFYLDTDFLFPETYETRDRVIERYGMKAVAYKSDYTPEQQAAEFGAELWKSNPDLCCNLRKVIPNKRALEGKRAWISGIRRDQASSRRETPLVQWDEKFGLVKINPLATWTEADVWKYVIDNDVPYNPLHNKSYPSLGCTYCTKPVIEGDDLRSGRWQGLDKEECGIHMPGEPIPLARGEDNIG